jgi:hypothetical protein
MAAPYSLEQGDEVRAHLTSQNFYGVSPVSNDGNGAIIVTVPDPPIYLAMVDAQTSAYQIGISWEEG